MEKRRAQSIMEYSIVLGVVVAILVGMQVYLKRGIQAGIKIAADQVGVQNKALPELDPREDAVQEGNSTSNTFSEKTMNVFGDAQSVTSEQVTHTHGSSRSERKEDGWYQIRVNGEWEMRRTNAE